MAQSLRYACPSCGHSIEAWSDGNPFYIDEKGEKRHAYHPNHSELAKCIANDVPHLCLQCAVESKIDSRLAAALCPECGSGNVVETFLLEGVSCPKCGDGDFVRDADFHCIS
jgi:predicted RNA-binding Zn-ribbon protein involved in translation (DUF1610 family)